MIQLKTSHSQAQIDPARGANLCSWSIQGRDIIYVDPSSYAKDQVKFVGGNPVMFPIFSTLGLHGENHLRYNGKSIQLNQHGLARLSKRWQAKQHRDNHVRLSLRSDEDSRKIFPWEFELVVEVELREHGMQLRQIVTNTGEETLPFVAGFHPYFCMSSAEHAEIVGLREGIPCYATSNHGPDDLKAHLPHRLPFGSAEVNHHFASEARTVQLIDRLKGRRIKITPSPEYPCLTVWNEPGQAFVCVEPVSGRRGAFQTREHLTRLAPQNVWKGQIDISVEQL